MAGAAAAAQQQQQLGRVFADLYASIGWHPHHRNLMQLLANATGSSGGSSWDPAALAAALLEAAAAASPGADASGGSSSGGAGGGNWLDAVAAAPAPGPSSGSGSAGPVDISWVGLLLAAAVIGINGLISAWLRLGLHGKLAVATVRCFAQLSLLGYILVPIFLADHWWLTLLYTLFMLAVAAVEAVSRPTQTYNGMLLQVLAALGLASSAIISYGLALVVQVSPWYDPQYLIPMLGMLLGNACSGVAVGLSAILDDLSSGRDKVEMLLAMGATRMEATRDVVQRATRMALTPLLNTMNVVGIVSIPGMMTGQILGGSDPAKAARYQIIIMLLIGAATGISSVAAIFMAVASILDDKHRLRSERLVTRPSTAKGAVAWLGMQVKQAWRSTRTRSGQLGTRVKLAFAGNGGRTRRPVAGAGAAAAAGYRPLPSGGATAAAAAGGGSGTDDATSDSSSFPSRLREVLVAGSEGSSPPDASMAQQALLAPPALSPEPSSSPGAP